MDEQKYIDKKYEVVEKLGGGGMGEVFLVKNPLDKPEKLALKVLDPQVKDRLGVSRFKREFYLMSHLDSPKITPVYDFGEYNDRLYFTMEYVKGKTLAEIGLQENKRKVIDILAQICEGLEIIHSQNILHLDLKPSNIFITEDNGVKLIDFGLAQAAKESITAISGTLPYVPPERIKKKPFDHRADLYSLGVLAYELLSGSNPFTAETVSKIIDKQLDFYPNELPDLESPLQELVFSLLKKDPFQRPNTASQVRHQLNEVLDREPEQEFSTGTFIPNGKLLSREQNLDDLKNVFDELGKPTFVSLQGEKGVGKGRIIEDFKPYVQTEGGKFLSIPENSDSVDLNLISPLIDVDFFDRVKKFIPDLAYFIPELREHPVVQDYLATESKNRIAQDREQFWHILVRILREISQQVPVIISFSLPLEDPLLEFVVKNPPEIGRIMYLSSSEPISKEDLSELCKVQSQRISVSPLEEGEVEPYLNSIFGSIKNLTSLKKQLYNSTEGHPEEIREVLKELLQAKVLQPSPQGWVYREEASDKVIKEFRELWRERISDLKEKNFELLTYFLPIKKAFPFELLENLMEDKEALALSLTDLMNQNLIKEKETGKDMYYTLASPELRELLKERIPEQKRRKLYKKVGEIILQWDDENRWVNEVAQLYYTINEKEKALQYTKQAVKISRKRFNYEQAKANLCKHLELLDDETDKSKKIQPLKILALTHKNLGNTNKARQTYKRALNICQEVENKKQVADTYNDIGVTYYNEKDYSPAEEYYQKAINIGEEINYNRGLGLYYNNLGAVKLETHNLNQSSEYFSQSEDLTRKTDNEKLKKLRKTIVDLNMGEIKFKQGDFPEAQERFTNSANLSREIDNQKLLCRNLIQLARLHRFKQQFPIARKGLSEAEDILNKAKTPDLLFDFIREKNKLSLISGKLDEIRERIESFLDDVPFTSSRQELILDLHKAFIRMEEDDIDALQKVLRRLQNSPAHSKFSKKISLLIKNIINFKQNRSGDFITIFNELQDYFASQYSFYLQALAFEFYINALIKERNLEKAQDEVNIFENDNPHICDYIEGKLHFLKAKLFDALEYEESFKESLNEAKLKFERLNNNRWLHKIENYSSQFEEERELSKRNADFENFKGLFQIIRAINSTLDISELLDLIVSKIIEVAGTERGLLLLNKESGLDFVVGKTSEGDKIDSEQAEYSSTIVEEVLETGEPKYSENIAADNELAAQKSIVDLDLKTAFCVPIKYENEIEGVIYTDAQAGEVKLSEEERLLLQAFADNASVALQNARVFDSLQEKTERLEGELTDKFGFDNIVGNSPPMRELFRKLNVVSSREITVLILGETGTGKDLVAKSIHYNSNRKENPFMVINCAAVPANLLETELFGHEKGAFTGADKQKKGKFEVADGGTILLNEIGDMPKPLQAKLLRVLEEKTFQRVGGTKDIEVNVRILAATNKDLNELIKEGEFREDLYYRISTITLELPAIRDRIEDIPSLVKKFIQEAADKFNIDPPKVSVGTMDMFKSYDWPGNVRELKNLIEQLVLFAQDGVITPDMIPEKISSKCEDETEVLQLEDEFEENYPRSDEETSPSHSLPEPSNIEELKDQKKKLGENHEKKVIKNLLEAHDWNITHAAEDFGIHRTRLHQLINKYDLRQE